MVDTTALPGATGTPGTPPVPKMYTEEERNSAAAAARREAETKLAEAQIKLTAFQTQFDELKQKDLSEVEKAKKETERLAGEVKRLNEIETQWNGHIKNMEDQYTALVTENKVSDADQDWLKDIPIQKRVSALNSLLAFNKIAPPGGVNHKQSAPALSMDDINKISDPTEKRKAFDAYKKQRFAI